MPGMMDTVLNLGCTAAVRQAFVDEAGEAFAADVFARFQDMYTRIVLEGEGSVPDDPWEQLHGAILAVFGSWASPRAVSYRQHHAIDGLTGTAVTVQAMVYGNLDGRSGSGVLFTRDPLTGAGVPFGEWLPCAQGEDVVSGRVDPRPLSHLADALPDVHHELVALSREWERRQRDIQDIEFTVQRGRLWVLQSRAAKRSPVAAARLAVAFADEGICTPEEALDRVSAEQVTNLMRPALQPEDKRTHALVAKGLAACPGVGRGRVVTDPDDAVLAAEAGEDVVLVRETTSPDDVHGMIAAVAVVTELGGATSHAAVVSRELGLPCVVGAGVGIADALDGTVVTVDGASGEVFEGTLPLVALDEDHEPALSRLAGWAQERAEVIVHRAPDADADLALEAALQGADWVEAPHPLVVLLRLREARVLPIREAVPTAAPSR
jgi:pyruvate,orthophosphate dikinase